MKKLIIAFAILGGLAFIWINWFSLTVLPGIQPVISPPPASVGDALDDLSAPPNLSISVYADDLPGARVLALGPDGDIWVSQTSEGRITKIHSDGTDVTKTNMYSGLDRPHGIAFDYREPTMLYYAEVTRLSRIDVSNPNATPEVIAELPPAIGWHYSRTIQFGPDGDLYVSMGSSCNVCHETDERYASIYRYDMETGSFTPFATGLRNTVFFTWSYVDGRMWGTDMGRDNLGDDLPPDEINVIEADKFYGWPTCYGKNIHDTDFDKNTYIRNPCMEPFETPSTIDLPAHSAPLGLAFVPEEGWPEEWWYDLIVAYHGSWNRSEPTGYNLARIKLDAQGNYEGTEDFVTNWLTPEGALGRPVDLLIFPGGTMYVSDDKAGVVYKLSYDQES